MQHLLTLHAMFFSQVTVIIMSLKAASLGLNMVAACHVLLLDVWWNPTTEDQAIDRAHRIGQTRTVRVSRFTVRNTIEDRILALQVQFLISFFLPFSSYQPICVMESSLAFSYVLVVGLHVSGMP